MALVSRNYLDKISCWCINYLADNSNQPLYHNYRIGGRFSMPLILCYQFIHYLSQKTRGKMR